jgi:pimeloyl-ACP methyl ester carboxylesterase
MDILLRSTLYLLIAYAILTAFMYFFQRRLLYLPDLEKPSQTQLQQLGLQFWPDAGKTTDSSVYRGLLSTAAMPQIKGTVVVFHGNAGAAWQRDYYLQALQPLGYRVILAEYPGYGGRPGSPGESVFVADARQTLLLAYQQFGEPLFLWGESLGAGVAAATAAAAPVPLAAVILLTPWDTLPDPAQTLYWYLPARQLVRDRYDSIENLRAFQSRLAVIVADQDEVIPSRHALKLYQTLPQPKRLWRFAGAGHNSWPLAADENWWREVMDFVSAD